MISVVVACLGVNIGINIGLHELPRFPVLELYCDPKS